MENLQLSTLILELLQFWHSFIDFRLFLLLLLLFIPDSQSLGRQRSLATPESKTCVWQIWLRRRLGRNSRRTWAAQVKVVLGISWYELTVRVLRFTTEPFDSAATEASHCLTWWSAIVFGLLASKYLPPLKDFFPPLKDGSLPHQRWAPHWQRPLVGGSSGGWKPSTSCKCFFQILWRENP